MNIAIKTDSFTTPTKTGELKPETPPTKKKVDADPARLSFGDDLTEIQTKFPKKPQTAGPKMKKKVRKKCSETDPSRPPKTAKVDRTQEEFGSTPPCSGPLLKQSQLQELLRTPEHQRTSQQNPTYSTTLLFRTPQVDEVGGQPQTKLPRYKIMSANSTHNDKTFTLTYTTTNRAIFEPNPKRHGTLTLIKELSSNNGVTVYEAKFISKRMSEQFVAVKITDSKPLEYDKSNRFHGNGEPGVHIMSQSFQVDNNKWFTLSKLGVPIIDFLNNVNVDDTTKTNAAMYICLELLELLKNMNYFHLDIKPANIIVQTTPTDGKSHIRFIDLHGSRPKDDKNLDSPIRIPTITTYYAPNGNLLGQDYAFPKQYDEHCMLKTIEEILGKVSVPSGLETIISRLSSDDFKDNAKHIWQKNPHSWGAPPPKKPSSLPISKIQSDIIDELEQKLKQENKLEDAFLSMLNN